MQRFDYGKVAPGAYHAMSGLERYLHECGLEESLLHLIKLRASQLNGCAYCLDMHWKDLKAIGEQDQRMYELDAWEEGPFYSERERAASWSEARSAPGRSDPKASRIASRVIEFSHSRLTGFLEPDFSYR